MKKYFFSSDILMPDFDKYSGDKWAVIACDQFTSEPEYWNNCREFVGDAPSTLNIILPEAYLDESEERIPQINATMEGYLKDVLVAHKNSMIYLERVQSDGAIRRGIVGMIDLEEYDYNRGSTSLTRATEGTVLERIPPRVKVRKNASLESPHIMLLIDDPQKTVIEPIAKRASELETAYEFDLMLNGGHVHGRFIDDDGVSEINSALEALASLDSQKNKYGLDNISPLLFAVGDGNHSLATAKAIYAELKQTMGDDAMSHPARYALVELVNLHDDSLQFEPIYRLLVDVDPKEVLDALREYASRLSGDQEAQKVTYFTKSESGEVVFEHPSSQLTVGTLQNFMDEYVKQNPNAKLDFIHGEQSLKTLATKSENSIGFIFDGMSKNQLFKTVICDGALPRKTFSMGHAEDKRYYIECRKIK